jgi:TonB family protein
MPAANSGASSPLSAASATALPVDRSGGRPDYWKLAHNKKVFMVRLQLIVLVLFAKFGFGFQSSDPLKQVSPLKSGVLPPVVTYKLDPNYTDEAKDAGVSGTVLLQLVVDEQGRAAQIEVLSPLGYGLDENAIKAVSQWRWRPGTKDDMPVKIPATIEVTFHGVAFDQKAAK